MNMETHDPLCPFSDTFGAPCMYCALIVRVRADERESVKAEYVPVLMEHLRILADLRAGVETLRDADPHYQPVRDAYDAVLALFEGLDP